MSKGLGQWKNNLKPSQIADGMNAANKNAIRLLEDAESLFALDRFPSALSLAILSIEESGKVSILRELALAKNGDQVKEAWKAYRSHTKKNVMWIFPSLVADGAKKLEDFKDVFNNESEHPQLLDNLKQIGFYTDCLGKAHWSIPVKVIDKENATQMITIAKTQCKEGNFTAREIELWIKHLKPVWRGSMDVMKTALNNWFEDMKKEQLITEHELSFKAFVGE
ncbi:AbiV family abortive infection protein [Shewanella sp. CG12_big_fil_rev_8_21_14_0_65_47_15]|uniref:AbiV family abortive infection protein n=1 Tax=Shewanella sp. CG12_big_fil_rev_8_21_14_0_65_47_15 TaxID=1975537 RepID=UPI000CCA2F8F|nr:AbiV family abortive infection protein [Shewanella sp. CG12_big_fil_rev_8_21_14_0_65_47_15]PIW61948.1 MAG: AbiV family abortive infection protein [Shewanella sp. CG12_big_fil_rev_8_21_14_0_65_47_15]